MRVTLPIEIASLIVVMAAFSFATSCGPSERADVDSDVRRNSFSYNGEFASAWGEETFAWPVSGGRALLSWEGTNVGAGEFVLAVLDAEDEQVYFGRAVGPPPAAETSAWGTAGEWRLEISYRRLEGIVSVAGSAIID